MGDMESYQPERRRPPSWVSKWKDPGIVIIVLGLCVTTGKMVERQESLGTQNAQLAQIVTTLSKTVTELAVQVTNQSNQQATIPAVTSSVVKLESRMDASEKSSAEFRADLKGWMIRVETKIDQRDQRDRNR